MNRWRAALLSRFGTRRARLRACGLFDERFYLERHPDVAAAGVDAALHYIRHGAAEGREPHPLFDPSWYLAQLAEPIGERTPLEHYLAVGAGQGLWPHPLFDPKHYARAAGIETLPPHAWLGHFLHEGAIRGISPHALLDAEYYGNANPDIAAAGLGPVWHFFRHGATEGRAPHPLFDPRWYLAQVPRGTGARSPIAHYLAEGAQRGLSPHPLFDPKHYARAAGIESQPPSTWLEHFVREGEERGISPHPLVDLKKLAAGYGQAGALRGVLARFGADVLPPCDPHPLFDVSFYCARHPDLARRRVNPLVDYLRAAEPGDPSPYFDTRYYLAQRAAPLPAHINPLVHYLAEGAGRGQSPHPLFDPKHYARAAGIESQPPSTWLEHFVREGEERGISPHALIDLEKLAAGYGQGRAMRGVLARFTADASPPCDPHPLFDVSFYCARHPDLARRRVNPLVDYLRAAEPGDPSPYFDTRYYLAQRAAPLPAHINPLMHYLAEGAGRGQSPHPLFDPKHYARAAGIESQPPSTWLEHFVREGEERGISPHPLIDLEKLAAGYGQGRAMRGVLARFTADASPPCDPHPLFDVSFYRARHPEAAKSGVNPLVHYLAQGAERGEWPHPLFDPEHYARAVGIESQPPSTWLAHFVREGEERGISPHPLIDLEKLAAGYGQAGAFRGVLARFAADASPPCDPHPLFDVSFYRARHPDLAEPRVNPLVDYLGAAEPGDPSPYFDTRYYLAQLAVPPPAHISPLRHYVEIGGPLGLTPSPRFDPQSFAASHPGPEHAGVDLLSLCLRRHSGTVPAAYAPPQERPGRPTGTEPRYYQGALAAGNKPRVLLVGHSAGKRLFGGERSFLDMVRAASAQGYAVFAVLPRVSPSYIEMLLPFCAEVAVMRYGWWRGASAPDPSAVEAFRRHIVERRIGLVHSNTIMLREPLLAARAERVPGLLHLREIIEQDPDLLALIGEPAATINERVQALADVVVANSRASARNFPAERTRVLPNCIDIGRFDFPPRADDGTVRFGMVSSNLPKKGLADFVALARACHGRMPAARFIAVGPLNDFSRALRQDLQQAGLAEAVEFPGYIDDAAEAIASIDVVVNFSHFAESFGRTVLEAMAARRPAIVYDHGALPEVVEHGVTGFVVPYRQWEAALPALEQLCADPALRQRLGKAAVRAARKFTQKSYAATLGGIYREALEAKPRPRAGAARASALPPPRQVMAARDLAPPLRLADLRLAYFCWHFPVPSETFVLNELRYLVEKGVDVRVFCRRTPHRDFQPDFPITWERVATPEELAKRLAETHRNFVHAHFAYPTVTDMVWPACQAAAIPFTFIPHAQDIFVYENDARNRIGEIAASPECVRVLALGSFHREYLLERGVPDGKLLVMHQGIDPRLFPHQSRDWSTRGKKVIAVQRFIEKKGLDRLIRAAALLREDDVSVELHGYGPEEEKLRELAASLGATNVRFPGRIAGREALLRVLADADLVAAPGVRTPSGDMDGIPTILVEAMAAGVPVLATPVASVTDLVVPGVTGFIAEDAEPAKLAQRMREVLAAPADQLEAMTHAARERVESRFNTRRQMPALLRLWCNQRIDIVIVSWNNLPELREVISRIFRFTRLPFHLVVCDNDSAPEVREYLGELHRAYGNVTVIDRGLNTYVGPGTNCAIDQGRSDYIVYLCGKEAFILQHGWERAVIDYMDDHPRVGLAGTLGYSPKYLRGADYPNGIEAFPKFRNRDFATANAQRVFRHVQGGLFAIRRAMYDEIGGFSEDVPHNHTDVEYSFYVESCGWELGEIPGLLALYKTTRPPLASRFSEQVLALHPPTLAELPQLEAALAGRTALCNVCFSFLRDGFAVDGRCPQCGATPAARTLMRSLAESTLTYRRLRALVLEPPPGLERFLSEQFQGRQLRYAEALDEIERGGELKGRPESLELAYVGRTNGHTGSLSLLPQALARVLAPGSSIFVDHSMLDAMQGPRFRHVREVRYASRVVAYDPQPLHVFALAQ